MLALILVTAVYLRRKLEQLPVPGGSRLFLLLVSLLVVVALVEPFGLWRSLVG